MLSHRSATYKEHGFTYISFQGLPMQHFFSHHDEPRSRNLVSEYDDKYNRRGCNPVLPPLHSWNRRKFPWIPQKSDFPILVLIQSDGTWCSGHYRDLKLGISFSFNSENGSCGDFRLFSYPVGRLFFGLIKWKHYR